jgi:hypothetical protein
MVFSRPCNEFHLRPGLCPILLRQFRPKLLHLVALSAHQVLAATLAEAAKFSSLTMPRSNTQIPRA